MLIYFLDNLFLNDGVNRNIKKHSMKIITLIIITSLSMSFSYAQKLHKSFYSRKIDSLTVFSPLGNISASNTNSIVPDQSLTLEFLPKYKSAIEKVSPFKVSIVENEGLKDRDHQKYFVKLMERVKTLDNKTFSNVKIGKNIHDIIDGYSGRYFCFVFYSGLDENKQDNITAGISGNFNGATAQNLYFPLAIEQPFLKSYLVIVDKKNSELVYFNESKVSASPLKSETSETQIKELLEAYLQK